MDESPEAFGEEERLEPEPEEESDDERLPELEDELLEPDDELLELLDDVDELLEEPLLPELLELDEFELEEDCLRVEAGVEPDFFVEVVFEPVREPEFCRITVV